MEKTVSLVLALVVLLALVPASFAADAPRKPIAGVNPNEVVSANLATCTGDRVRVRAEAWGKVLGRLYKGDMVEVIALSGDWARVKYSGGEAYVFAAYLTIPSSVLDAVADETAAMGSVAPRAGNAKTPAVQLFELFGAPLTNPEGKWLIVYLYAFDDKDARIFLSVVRDGTTVVIPRVEVPREVLAWSEGGGELGEIPPKHVADGLPPMWFCLFGSEDASALFTEGIDRLEEGDVVFITQQLPGMDESDPGNGWKMDVLED